MTMDLLNGTIVTPMDPVTIFLCLIVAAGIWLCGKTRPL
jgi:hypothetical protein